MKNKNLCPSVVKDFHHYSCGQYMLPAVNIVACTGCGITCSLAQPIYLLAMRTITEDKLPVKPSKFQGGQLMLPQFRLMDFENEVIYNLLIIGDRSTALPVTD